MTAMAYLNNLLSSGEQMIRREHQHWFVVAANARYAIVAWLGAILLFIISGAMPDGIRAIFGWAMVALVVGGLLSFGWQVLRWQNEEFVVTSRRVLKTEGVVNKRVIDSSLEKINDAILEQSVFGRMFDWGHLKVLTAAEEVADDYHMLHHAPTFKKTMLLAKQDIEDELARRITAPLEALNAHELEEDRKQAEALASARAAAAPIAPPPPVPVQKTTEEKLRELAALRDAGLITPEDYEAKKTTILAVM
jgi:uncharacterized membrane protein YdbT with pleckstrin-like domain